MRHRHDTELFSVLESRVLLSGDDHADVPDWAHATPLDLIPGLGCTEDYTYSTRFMDYTGVIDTPNDTDVFSFVAPGDAEVSVFSACQLEPGELAPGIELRDATGAILGSNDGMAGVAFIVPGYQILDGQTYYLVVRSGDLSQWATSHTGSYVLFAGMDLLVGPGDSGEGDGGAGGAGDGGAGSGDGGSGDDEYVPDDFPDLGENPMPLALNGLDADAEVAGGLQDARDTDAFGLYTPGAGPLRIQVITDDPDLRAEITLVTESGATLAVSDTGFPGAAASLQLVSDANQRYTIVVSSPDGAIGDYTLEVDASPALYHYFYPAGYSSPTIDEYIPMVNPNAFGVNYTVYAHYEVGDALQVLDTGTMAPHSRAGITVTDHRYPGASLTREASPYAFEIVASGPIGANLGHYDFGATTGEAFTDTLDTRWEFPEVVRAEGMRDLLVYYNPNKQRATIRFTLLDGQGVMHRFTRTLEGERRGGINVHTDLGVPGGGAYAVWMESDLPIVAAQTTYDAANGRGDGHLGQAGGGALAGSFPGVSTEEGTETSLAILNATGDEAVVRFTSPALATPYILRVPPRSRMSLLPGDIGFADGRSAPLTYASTTPITARVMQYRNGDGDAFLAATEAGTTFLNGAAWVDPRAKGTYIERLSLVNPAAEATEVTISFLFTDGTTATDTRTLGAGEGLTIKIDEHEAIVRRGGPTAFSLRVDAATPILASFVHYDMFLHGGWGTLAAPVGLTVPVAAMTR